MSVCIPIPPQIATPVLEAKVVQDIQNIFSSNLSWLENAYALVRTGIQGLQTEKEFKYPQIYSGATIAEYTDLQPNDKLKSYCFFEVEEPYEFDSNEEEVIFNLSVTFWFNLAKIDGRSYDYSSELIAHVLKHLRANQIYDSRIKDIRVEKRPEQVFNKYSMSQSETQFLMYPYGAFKIFFRITDDASCLPDFVSTNPNSCEV